MFELKPNRQHTKKVVLSLLIRYGFAVVTALIFYHCLPFSLEVRQVLVIISFAPIPALAPVFTAKCGGDTEIAGLVNSISILISIVAITALVSVMAVSYTHLSKNRRKWLFKQLGLPEYLSTNHLLEYLNHAVGYEEYQRLIQLLKQEENQ